ncbi:MAG: hypothetical protein ACRD8Z_28280, partial [Nitrososphaeraceae archaeon]
EIAAIVYPNIEDLSSDDDDDDYVESTELNGKWHKQQKKNSKHLLNGNLEQVADDLIQLGEIGVDLAILNYNRSLIGNSSDRIIDVTRQLAKLVK